MKQSTRTTLAAVTPAIAFLITAVAALASGPHDDAVSAWDRRLDALGIWPAGAPPSVRINLAGLRRRGQRNARGTRGAYPPSHQTLSDRQRNAMRTARRSDMGG
jgi:hypothetical protein